MHGNLHYVCVLHFLPVFQCLKKDKAPKVPCSQEAPSSLPVLWDAPAVLGTELGSFRQGRVLGMEDYREEVEFHCCF